MGPLAQSQSAHRGCLVVSALEVPKASTTLRVGAVPGGPETASRVLRGILQAVQTSRLLAEVVPLEATGHAGVAVTASPP